MIVEMCERKGTFAELERECERLFFQNGPFWHLYTPGVISEIIFRNREDFEFGMNLMGLCAESFPSVRIITFELMNNHLHGILVGPEEECHAFFALFKSRLQRYFRESGLHVSLDRFNATLAPITTLQALRNEIIYVNRNGYVVDSRCTPYSYYWGSGFQYFNPITYSVDAVRFDRMTKIEKRKIARSRVTNSQSRLLVWKGVILPSSYCYIHEGESYFRDAHHYFNALSKSHEAMSLVSRNLADVIVVTDEEMYSIASNLCNSLYSVRQPTLVSNSEKIELAKKLHYDYNATKKQLRRILKLDMAIINELFIS